MNTIRNNFEFKELTVIYNLEFPNYKPDECWYLFVCLSICVTVCRMLFISREMFIHMETMPMSEWPQMMIYIFEKKGNASFSPSSIQLTFFCSSSSTIKALIVGFDTLKTFHLFKRNIHHTLIHWKQKHFVNFFFLTERSRMGLNMTVRKVKQ